MRELIVRYTGAHRGHFLLTTENGSQHLLFLGLTHCDSWTRYGAPGRERGSDGVPRSVKIIPDVIRIGDTVEYYAAYNRGLRDYDTLTTSRVTSIEPVWITWEVLA